VCGNQSESDENMRVFEPDTISADHENVSIHDNVETSNNSECTMKELDIKTTSSNMKPLSRPIRERKVPAGESYMNCNCVLEDLYDKFLVISF